jgi:putative hydrolase of the HAD superfamily
MTIRTVGFDGDDTLWHSESHFEVTQGAFRDLLRRHVPDAEVERRLAEMEMKNLSVYGYGVKSFTLSMLETAIELTEGRIPASDLEVILGWGKRMLMEPTELLDGVEETLRKLSGRYDLLLITKGDLFDQNVESYRGIFQRRGIKPEDFVMVGNSLKSDVVPVVALGAHAVHIPYHVTWQHEHVPEEELPEKGWRRISSIRQLRL